MGTRSFIVKQETDERGQRTFKGIYCHWDGYPSHNGKVLAENYLDEGKVDQLIGLGDLSSLDENIGTQHDFSDRPEFDCTAYPRDRGEAWEDVKPTEFSNFQELRDYLKESWCEWLYIYSNNGQRGSWQVAQIGREGVYELFNLEPYIWEVKFP